VSLRFIPLIPGTNRPAVLNWQNLAATADSEQVLAWRHEFRGGCNWGVLTGNGLGVIDLDCHNEDDPSNFGGFATIIDVEELLGIDLSNLPLVQTFSGAHLYFRYEGHLPSKVPWLSHIDIMADGGHQVAGPGTVRQDRGVERTYTLVRGDLRAIPYAPDALLSAIRGWRVRRTGMPGSPSSGADLPSTGEALRDGLPLGSRNDLMHGLACRWWGVYGLASEATVWDLARRVWEATPGHDTFPWSEASKAVTSARDYIAVEADRNLAAIAAILKNWGQP
jgi:hypothetical protein